MGSRRISEFPPSDGNGFLPAWRRKKFGAGIVSHFDVSAILETSNRPASMSGVVNPVPTIKMVNLEMTIAERSLMRCYQNLTPGEKSTRPDFHSVAEGKNHHNGRINVGTGLNSNRNPLQVTGPVIRRCCSHLAVSISLKFPPALHRPPTSDLWFIWNRAECPSRPLTPDL